MEPHKLRSMRMEYYISRVPDQNGISQACYIAEIHHSGLKPSICFKGAGTHILV